MKVKVTDKSEVDTFRVVFLGRELEEAYSDYNKRKNNITSKLYFIYKEEGLPKTYKKWLKQAAEFILESDMK